MPIIIICFHDYSCEKLGSEGVDALMKHYFHDIVKSSCKSQLQTNTSQSSMETRKKTILKEGEEMRKAYLHGQRASNIQEETNCSCRDCDEENGGETGSDSDCDEERTNTIYYAPGISFKRRQTDPVFITEHFSLSRLKNILNVLRIFYDGISYPMMYMGQLHSFFPVHIEDTALWSINFLHFGAPKIWSVLNFT